MLNVNCPLLFSVVDHYNLLNNKIAIIKYQFGCFKSFSIYDLNSSHMHSPPAPHATNTHHCMILIIITL
jgi:hypothetical protein